MSTNPAAAVSLEALRDDLDYRAWRRRAGDLDLPPLPGRLVSVPRAFAEAAAQVEAENREYDEFARAAGWLDEA